MTARGKPPKSLLENLPAVLCNSVGLLPATMRIQRPFFASDEMNTALAVPGIHFEFVRLWDGDVPAALAEPAYQTHFSNGGWLQIWSVYDSAARAVSIASDERKSAYSEMERLCPGLAAHMEPSSPGMRTSDSIDFGYVISGSMGLKLDEERERELRAGVTFVQNGTRHVWRNRPHSRARCWLLSLSPNGSPLAHLSLDRSAGSVPDTCGKDLPKRPASD